MQTNKFSVRAIVLTGIVAALYAVLTVLIAPLSYDAIQFRFSEIMLLLIFFDRRFAPGLILGCAIANMFSPLGMVDVAVGTTATALALWAMAHTRQGFVATLWPTVTNAVLVGLELKVLYDLPFWYGAVTVAIGEFAVVSLIGYAFFKRIKKNERLVSVFRF